MKDDDDLRLEIGQHFRDHTDLANNLKYWGANNYLLSNLEKRIAKQLVNSHLDEQGFPSAAELAKTLGVSEDEVRGRLAFLHRAAFESFMSVMGDDGEELSETDWREQLRTVQATVGDLLEATVDELDPPTAPTSRSTPPRGSWRSS